MLEQPAANGGARSHHGWGCWNVPSSATHPSCLRQSSLAEAIKQMFGVLRESEGNPGSFVPADRVLGIDPKHLRSL
jgi:hypothetical protein